MKVLIIDNSSIIEKDGKLYTNQQNGEFIQELRDFHHDLTWFQILSSTPNGISNYDLKANGIKTKAIHAPSNKLCRYIWSYLIAIPHIIASDFVYLYYPTAFKYIGAICKLLGKPYGLYIRGMKDLRSKSGKLVISNAAAALSVSNNFTELVKSYNPQIRAATIRPMIPLTLDNIAGKYSKKFENEEVKMLYLGRIDKDKGIAELIKAAIDLNKYGDKRYVLTIVGAGQFSDEANRLASGYDFIHFVGAIYDPLEKKQYYTDADVFILPSYHEGFPRTLYEAMTYGAPILTTMVGGIPDIMKDSFNCLEIKVKSSESIVHKVRLLQESPQLIETVVVNGYKSMLPILDGTRLSHAHQLNNFLNEILQ